MRRATVVMFAVIVGLDSYVPEALSVNILTPVRWNDFFTSWETSRIQKAREIERNGDASFAKGEMAEAMGKYVEALQRYAVKCRTGFSYDSTPNGVRIKKLREAGPAQNAGFRVGDVITSINGQRHGSLNDWDVDAIFSNCSPGDQFHFVIDRGGQQLEIRLTSAMGFFDPAAAITNDLIAKIVRTVVAQKERPTVTKEMRELASMAQKEAKSAKTSDELETASNSYKEAVIAAPFWAELHFNYGLFADAAGDSVTAIRHLQHFVALQPNAADSEAVKTRIAVLAPGAREQTNLAAWEGWWTGIRDGRPLDTGMTVVRAGKTFHVSDRFGKQYISGTITGEFTATAVNVVTSDDPSSLVKRCFGGRMELAQTWELSKEKTQLIVYNDVDIQIDPSTCRLGRGGIRTEGARYRRD